MKKLFNIATNQVFEAQRVGLNLDGLYVLEYTEENGIIPLDNQKIAAIVSGLIRKGYLTEMFEITTVGKEVLALIREDVSDVKANLAISKEKLTGEFDKFWSEFPSHNGHGKFEKTRGFKTEKDKCKKLFEDMLKEGKYTTDVIIQGVKNHVEALKRTSKNGDNKLTYLHNSYTYLRNRDFEPFIGEDVKPVSNKQNNVVDI